MFTKICSFNVAVVCFNSMFIMFGLLQVGYFVQHIGKIAASEKYSKCVVKT